MIVVMHESRYKGKKKKVNKISHMLNFYVRYFDFFFHFPEIRCIKGPALSQVSFICVDYKII